MLNLNLSWPFLEEVPFLCLLLSCKQCKGGEGPKRVNSLGLLEKKDFSGLQNFFLQQSKAKRSEARQGKSFFLGYDRACVCYKLDRLLLASHTQCTSYRHWVELAAAIEKDHTSGNIPRSWGRKGAQNFWAGTQNFRLSQYITRIFISFIWHLFYNIKKKFQAFLSSAAAHFISPVAFIQFHDFLLKGKNTNICASLSHDANGCPVHNNPTTASPENSNASIFRQIISNPGKNAWKLSRIRAWNELIPAFIPERGAYKRRLMLLYLGEKLTGLLCRTESRVVVVVYAQLINDDDILMWATFFSAAKKNYIKVHWTPLIVATRGPVLCGHNNRWFLYPAVL